MSDSRAILLRLSVKDADVVRRELVAMGDQGAAALSRLDAAARAAAGSGGSASRGGGSGGGGMGGLQNAIGQAGFQLQDFAVQVQGGTSALTALSQQGSQFLGIFGPAGAIAGAVLTVGILASRLFGAADASKKMQEAQEALAGAMRITNDLFETQADRAERLEREQRGTAIAGLQTNFEMQAERVRTERNALQALEREIAERTAANANVPGFDPARIFGVRLQERRTALAVEEQALFELDRRLEELRNRPSSRTQERLASEYGPQLPPGGLPREREPRASARDNSAERAEEQRRRAREQFENIASSITPATRALREYEQRQESLTQFVEAGIISEQEFAETVEATTLALGRQLDEIENRANRTGDVSRQLGLTFTSAFEDAISRGKSLRDVLSGISQDVAKLIFRRGITEPFTNAVTPLIDSAASSVGTWFSSLIPRAAGGPVMAGAGYLVGERGPELFMPNSSGSIVPNHALGGPSINMSVNIDARGAGPREIDVLRAQIPGMVRSGAMAAVEDAARRGGGFARSLRGG